MLKICWAPEYDCMNEPIEQCLVSGVPCLGNTCCTLSGSGLVTSAQNSGLYTCAQIQETRVFMCHCFSSSFPSPQSNQNNSPGGVSQTFRTCMRPAYNHWTAYCPHGQSLLIFSSLDDDGIYGCHKLNTSLRTEESQRPVQ